MSHWEGAQDTFIIELSGHTCEIYLNHNSVFSILERIARFVM